MAKLYLKWTLLVWANAIIGLLFGLAWTGDDVAHNVGVVLGVCAFIPLYALIDAYAIKTGNANLQKSLLIGVVIRACLQVVMVVDIVAGLMASVIVENVFGLQTVARVEFGTDVQTTGFWHGFLMTIITGGVLSGVVAVLVFFVMLLMGFYQKDKP